MISKKWLLSIGGCVLLCSCGDGNRFSDAERDEISDIAGDAADVGAAITDDPTIAEMQNTISELEEEVQRQADRIEVLEGDAHHHL